MIRAISIDLDETLWPVGPAIAYAERSLNAWLAAHAPAVLQRFTAEDLRALRDEVLAGATDEQRSNMGFIRRTSIARALELVGDDIAKADAAYRAFDAGRQNIEFFPDARPALEWLAARYPLVALTNGTADIERIGIGDLFRGSVSPRDIGVGKPDARIFLAVCERLGCTPAEVLHVGDDAHLDVTGALDAGLRAAWVNRLGASWTHASEPHVIVRDLAELVAWLERAA